MLLWSKFILKHMPNKDINFIDKIINKISKNKFSTGNQLNKIFASITFSTNYFFFQIQYTKELFRLNDMQNSTQA